MSASPLPKSNTGYSKIVARANRLSSVIILLVAVLLFGGIGGYLYAHSSKVTPSTTTKVQTLSPTDIQKLSDLSTSLGSSSQTLNVGANSLFRGAVTVGGDLAVGGHFSANGPVTLSQLNISGNTALGGLNVGTNLNVAGLSTLSGGLSVAQLLTVNGGLNVSGAASVNSLNATSISTQKLNLSGPLTIGHIVSQGLAPSIVAGSGVGGGGTVSISGNDTTGTINISTGSGTVAGTLASITFRSPYGATVHVVLQPLTGAAAAVSAYVTRTAGGFTIRTDTASPTGAVLAYDYIIVQ